MVRQRYYWLDLIRFISALLVVAVHIRSDFFYTYSELPVSSQNLMTKIFYYLNSFGGEAVLIFFVMSGFLVGGISLNKLHCGKISIKDYAINRGVRIGVPLVSTLLLITIVDVYTTGTVRWLDLIGNLFSLQGILVGDVGGVFWTLAYEVWFYVLIGGIIVLLGSQKKLVGFILILLSLAAFTALETSLLFVLAGGIGAYYLSKFQVQKPILWLVLGLSILCSMLLHFASPSKARDVSAFSFLNLDILRLMYGFCIALIISQIVSMKPHSRFLNWLHLWGEKLAVFSYTLYLTHYQCIRLMHYWNVPKSSVVSVSTIALFLCEILVCVIFAYIFYYITEKQTDRVKQYVKRILK